MNNKAIAYFQKSALQYGKGDVEELLQKELHCAGPLLAVVVNGIDNLGGMCFGFKGLGSAKRSIKFMEKYMGLSQPVANFIYKTVRCGIAHQGMPKVGLEFGVLYGRPEAGRVHCKAYDWIYLNVVEFAYAYLQAIERIAGEPEKHIHDYPQLDQSAKDAFENALADIEEYSGKIHYHSSLAAYDKSYDLNVSIDLAPED